MFQVPPTTSTSLEILRTFHTSTQCIYRSRSMEQKNCSVGTTWHHSAWVVSRSQTLSASDCVATRDYRQHGYMPTEISMAMVNNLFRCVTTTLQQPMDKRGNIPPFIYEQSQPDRFSQPGVVSAHSFNKKNHSHQYPRASMLDRQLIMLRLRLD